MEKAYEPAAIEKRWYARWLADRAFHSTPDSSKKPYCIVIPPPNVTGILTMGHVLNNGCQDILIRWRRMQGYETLWLPGTDHAGIATQNKVVAALREQGIAREDLGREKFVERVWEWKEKYGSIILEQLKALGCACDWERERFTLDPGLSRAVREVFVRLYRKGLIYRGKYIVNWCPTCRTAISDEEVEHEERASNLWYIRYPFKDGAGGVTVATTRPETMLGDTAVAVNPKDERYAGLVGRTLVLPLTGREIPIIADDFVAPEFGTGAVKVTPAHDSNDFAIARRHDLPAVVVIDERARMTAAAGPEFEGLDRLDARRAVVARLTRDGLLVKTDPYSHAVGHCYRCATMVEPALSDQWYVRMQPLAAPAIRVVEEGRVRFFPERWTKVYLNWMNEIRDWCISRQLWWGHRIPIWTCSACGHLDAYLDDPERCPRCGGEVKQEEDVLDTWFSSWLWPFSTLGWPEATEDLKYYYPTATLVTGPDILFFWVARMIMAGLEFMGEIPFRDVYLHGIIRDEQGRKFSKSLGNSPDPLVVIADTGADALRFGLCLIAPRGQDLYYTASTLEVGRNFANKLWNAARFILMNVGEAKLADPDPAGPELNVADRWILHRLRRTAAEVDAALTEYRYNDAAISLYSFVWGDFCDWYLEFTKPVLYGRVSEGSAEAERSILTYCLKSIVKLLHPFMPFITEEIWHAIPGTAGSIQRAPFPAAADLPEALADPAAPAVREMGFLQAVIGTIRTIRGEMGIKPGATVKVYLKSGDPWQRATLARHAGFVIELARTEPPQWIEALRPGEIAATGVADGLELFVDLAGQIDLAAETARLEKELRKTAAEIERVGAKLANPSFVANAPAAVVAKERRIAAELADQRAKLQAAHERLARILG